jgi:nucleotide-binding universal stress UspA family protein
MIEEGRTMFKVCLAVDGSPASTRALEFARTLLAGKETSLTLFHVIPQHYVYGKGGVAPVEVYDMQEVRAASQSLLEDSLRSLRDGGVGPTIETRMATGDPAELILEAAAEDGADLIILGSRGLNAASRFLLGSVSTKVTTHAHCAVLVVPPAGRGGAGRGA